MVWRFLEKLRIKLSYGPASPLLGIHPKEPKARAGREICTPVFEALFTVATGRNNPGFTDR